MLAFGAGCSSSGANANANTCRNLENGIPLCGPDSVEVPLEAGSSSPVIIARINGREARVLVDTGAQAPIISSSWLGVSDAQWIRTEELCFGELCLEGEQVYAQDTEFSQPDAAAINGFIGMRTLQHFAVEFVHGTSVRFSQKPTCQGVTHPLAFGDEGTPFADIRIDGHAFSHVAIDSGSTFTVLSQATVDLLAPYVTARGQVADLCTVDGCMTGVAQSSSVKEYCVFDVCEPNVPVKFPAFDAIGSSFLFLQDSVFDFPNGNLAFCDVASDGS